MEWFSPICDMILARIEAWRAQYTRGEVSATCPYHDPIKGIIDAPTRYAHIMVWHPKEMEYLIRMVEGRCPNTALVEEVKCLREVLQRGKMTAGGGRTITLNFYPEHVDQILEAVRETKLGKTKAFEDYKDENGSFF